MTDFNNMMMPVVRGRNYVDFFRTLSEFGTWCTVVCKVFDLYHFHVDESPVRDLEEYCVQVFKQDMQDIFSEVPLNLRTRLCSIDVRKVVRRIVAQARGIVRNTPHVTMDLLRGQCIRKLLLWALGVAKNDEEREWIHDCLDEDGDLKLLMDTRTLRDIYQLTASRPWIFANFEWDQLNYFRTVPEQVDVELEAHGPELDVMKCAVLCPATEDEAICLICQDDIADKDKDCVRTVASEESGWSVVCGVQGIAGVLWFQSRILEFQRHLCIGDFDYLGRQRRGWDFRFQGKHGALALLWESASLTLSNHVIGLALWFTDSTKSSLKRNAPSELHDIVMPRSTKKSLSICDGFQIGFGGSESKLRAN